MINRPLGSQHSYSNNSDIGNYFWGSKDAGRDPSNGQAYTYYCYVPVSDVYDMQLNPKGYEDIAEAAENEKYVAVNWMSGKGAVVVVTEHPTPITYIQTRDGGDGGIYDLGGVFDAKWHLLRTGSLPYYQQDFKKLARKLKPYKDLMLPDFLANHGWGYDEVMDRAKSARKRPV